MALLSLAAGAQTAEDYLRHRWYRVEVVLFEQLDQHDGGAATASVVQALRYPRLAVPLAERAPPADATLPFGAPLAAYEDVPLVISNLAPPIWYAGECAAELWQPAGGDDPCLPQRVDLEAVFSDDPFAGWAEPSEPAEEAPLESVPDPREVAMEALEAAVEEHERQLMATSYVWRRQTSALAPALRGLRRRTDVIAAGSWHQALPPRDAPQPLVVQLGKVYADQRFPLEGWLSVTAGRYVHFKAHLAFQLPRGNVAVFNESRRMKSGEIHYLDHPALGILASVQPLEVPYELERLADEYRFVAGQ